MNVHLTPTEWNTILKALSEAPYKLAAPIIEKIMQAAKEAETVPRETSQPE
jgi:hypothetical protein